MATTTQPDHPQPSRPSSATPFSGRVAWQDNVPAAVIEEQEWSSQSPGWKAWRKYLKQREDGPLPWLLKDKRSPLLWCLPELSEGVETEAAGLTEARISALHKARRGRLAPQWNMADEATAWLADRLAMNFQDLAIPPLGWAAECVAWAYALPRLTRWLPSETWWALAEQLFETAEDAVGGFPAIESETPRVAALTQQLLAGELPLALATGLPEMECFARLAELGRQVLNDALEQLLDGEGLPAAQLLPYFRPLAACWTRCAAMLQMLPEPGWNKASRGQYRFLAGHLLRFCKADGRAMLAQGRAGDACPALLQAVLRQANDSDAWRYAASLEDRSLGLKSTYKANAPAGLKPFSKKTPAAYSSEWSEAALLRRNWQSTSPSLAVRYDGAEIEAELNIGRHGLLNGAWTTEVHVNGERLQPSKGWACVCWETDSDVDYLELEMALGSGVRLQRQFLLARQDGFALLADALLSQQPGKLSVRSRFPLAPGMSFEPAATTREGSLKDDKPRALLLPLALPEWRSAPAGGEFALHDGALDYVLQGHGRALFAPLFIDLDGRRLRRNACTWRALTVAQERRILPPDDASGFRVQIGEQQWLAYRSLMSRGSRTVLGLNTNYEYVVGRFDREEGVIDPLLQVE